MSIEELYSDFIESEHEDSACTSDAICAAQTGKAEIVIDGIEEELHRGFVSGFIAGIDFMKGAIR